MDLHQTEFEKSAIRAYHKEPWMSEDESDRDTFTKEGGELELSSSRSSQRVFDIFEEGGSSRSPKKVKKDGNQEHEGFMSGFFGNNNSKQNQADRQI